MSFTHASYALRIGVSISHTFQHRRYISIARTGNVIMYALGLFFAKTIPYLHVYIVGILAQHTTCCGALIREEYMKT